MRGIGEEAIRSFKKDPASFETIAETAVLRAQQQGVQFEAEEVQNRIETEAGLLKSILDLEAEKARLESLKAYKESQRGEVRKEKERLTSSNFSETLKAATEQMAKIRQKLAQVREGKKKKAESQASSFIDSLFSSLYQ